MKPHGAHHRGLFATKRSPLFEGFFGRMFRNLPPGQYGATEEESQANLKKLGGEMVADFDPPKDGPDDEESGIPALYTYLGQFIDHDLTFDPSSLQQKHKDPDALVDFRTPAFDLDNVYGGGPDDQPYMYMQNGMKFLLGDRISDGPDENARDLPRNGGDPARALIGDPRNDENSIVSQLHGLFLRFHNRTVDANSGASFPAIQRLVRFHYQYVVLNDFLPRIVHSSVLDSLKTDSTYDRDKIMFYRPHKEPFMPVEFSVAAYRLGHSMVRPGYRLNDNDATLLPIFPVPDKTGPDGLTGFQRLTSDRGIDWGRFIDIDTRPTGSESTTDPNNKRRLQFAYRIDTSAVGPLGLLPASVAADQPRSLPQRNLLRGLQLGLPTGQSVARAMHVKPLSDEQILIGKFVDEEPPAGDPDALQKIIEIAPDFEENCPLWTYILAETRNHKEKVALPTAEKGESLTPRLGPVGGRIVAEVFLGIMFGDDESLLNVDPGWTPPKVGANYALRDFVSYALGN